MDREVFERLARLETMVEAQGKTLDAIKRDVERLMMFRAGLLMLSSVVSTVVSLLIAYFK